MGGIVLGLIGLFIINYFIGKPATKRKEKRESKAKLEEILKNPIVDSENREFILSNISKMTVHTMKNYIDKFTHLIEIYNRLIGKYNNEFINRALSEFVWIDMTKDELLDAHGKAQFYDKTIFKTKTKEKYYYSFINKTIIVENEKVVQIKNGQ